MIFPKDSLFAFVALAVSLQAAASPILQSRSPQGVSVPLPKRSGLRSDDGVFDLNKAVARMVRTQNKHTQNLLNFQANTGSLPFEVNMTFFILRVFHLAPTFDGIFD